MKTAVIAFLLTPLLIVAGYVLFYPLPGMQARPTLGDRLEISRDGRKLAYYVRGTGSRVTLAASAGRESSDFNELTTTLVGAGFRTIAIEAPGIKGSDMPAKDVDLYDLAADVKAIIDADIRNTPETAETDSVLIGHAFGNRVMRATATRYPEISRATILIAAGGKHAVPERANEALKNCFNPIRTAAQRLEDIRYAFFAEGNDIPDYWQRGWHMQTAVMQGKASPATLDKEWLPGGSAPMLVVQAVSDRIAPREDAADELQKDLGSRVKVALIEGAGHALLPEQPEKIAEAILNFLDDIPY